MSTPPTALYRRILLKLSGEALMGDGDYGIDPNVLDRVAAEIVEVTKLGVQVGVVIGGGNIYRGAALANAGMDRVTGDQMGMLATVMNALAMGDALERAGVESRVMSAIPMLPVAEAYGPKQAIRHMQAGRVALFSAGTGNPFFTTDTAASLRAVEIGADVMFKATKVDGVYTADPVKDPSATKYEQLSYTEVLDEALGVMDLTAIVLCQEQALPLRVINMNTDGEMLRAISDSSIGTLVHQ